MHTTTFAEMFDLPGGGKVIDTPGVREFGIIHIERHELSHYFPEMRNLLNLCQFNNCMHVNEPGCAVKAAVFSGEEAEKEDSRAKITEERYLSYLTILSSIPEQSW
jgi:ribosome biogenesis GTPase